MKTTTVRIPDGLALEAQHRADWLGLSLNALIAVALDAYLGQDRQRGGTLVAQLPSAPHGNHGEQLEETPPGFATALGGSLPPDRPESPGSSAKPSEPPSGGSLPSPANPGQGLSFQQLMAAQGRAKAKRRKGGAA